MSNGHKASDSSYPTALEAGLEKALSPFQAFIHDQTSGSILLLLCTVTALILAIIDDLGAILVIAIFYTKSISLFCWLALRLGLGRLPEELTVDHILGIGLISGMGFTISMIIAGLGFGDSPGKLVDAKSAILIASLAAGLLGYLWLRLRSEDHGDG